MEEVDIEKYTKDEAYKNFIAIEGHLEKFSDYPLFCKSCLYKHFAYLEILSEECGPASCKLNPIYERIKPWAKKAKRSLDDLDKEKVEQLARETRDFRKELEHMGEKEIHLGEKHLSNPGLTGNELLLHAVPYLEGSPGIVVDEDIALATPCHGARFDTSEIIFSKGIIGGLDEKQKVKYCKLGTTYETKGALVERIRKFKEAIATAKERYTLEHKPGITRWLALTGQELRKRGIEL